MSELIRRSDAIAIIQNAKYKFPTWPHIAEAKEDMVQAIKSAPTIDAVPVVRGEWEDIPNRYVCVAGDRPYHGNATSCSVCHEVNPNAFKTNYCPNCGAKMESEGGT